LQNFGPEYSGLTLRSLVEVEPKSIFPDLFPTNVSRARKYEVVREAKCIYCGVILRDEPPAHVVPEGMGGRLASSTSVCRTCNNDFSETEGKACLRIAPFMALAGARRGDGPFVRAKRIEHEGKVYDAAGGRMTARPKPPENRGRHLHLPTREEDFGRVTSDWLDQLGLPPEALLDGRARIQTPEPLPDDDRPVEPITLTFRWDGDDEKRVMTKAAIELMAYFDAPLACRNELTSAKRFARDGEGFIPCWVDTETSGACLPRVNALWIHGIEIWTAGTKLNYRWTLFTELHVVATLTDQWHGGPFRASYTFDILAPGTRTQLHEFKDGAALVNKSDRVHSTEFTAAMKRMEATSIATSAMKRTRTPVTDALDLHRKVLAFRAKRRH
jgi:hypothetical protein